MCMLCSVRVRRDDLVSAIGHFGGVGAGHSGEAGGRGSVDELEWFEREASRSLAKHGEKIEAEEKVQKNPTG